MTLEKYSLQARDPEMNHRLFVESIDSINHEKHASRTPATRADTVLSRNNQNNNVAPPPQHNTRLWKMTCEVNTCATAGASATRCVNTAPATTKRQTTTKRVTSPSRRTKSRAAASCKTRCWREACPVYRSRKTEPGAQEVRRQAGSSLRRWSL